MDPDANLAEQRRLWTEIRRLYDLDDPRGRYDAQIAEHADRLAELGEALDEWIAHGGFLPRVWQGGRR